LNLTFVTMRAPSDHFNGKIFLNPVQTDVMRKGSFAKVMLKWFQKHPNREPDQPLGPFDVDLNVFNEPIHEALRVTWLGHSSVLLEMDGTRFLADPLWYKRASPFKYVGPKRFFDNPITIDDLPPIDFILLSHDHYDHLDKQALLQLTAKSIPVITMIGVGKRLTKWGVPERLVTELDWWQSIKAGALTITAAPTRHFSGRWINDRFTTLWGAFAVRGPLHNIYYGADSGYFEGFREIGERLGSFDLTMLEIGAYNQDWETIHMGPEAAVQAHIDLRGRLLMPLHWGTFSLAFHPWKEPVERLQKRAQERNVALLLPAPGETYNVDNGSYNSQWWEQFR
jgi:L-ascorbate metabolism protein UlaG (beta-lactamase superfamily)